MQYSRDSVSCSWPYESLGRTLEVAVEMWLRRNGPVDVALIVGGAPVTQLVLCPSCSADVHMWPLILLEAHPLLNSDLSYSAV